MEMALAADLASFSTVQMFHVRKWSNTTTWEQPREVVPVILLWVLQMSLLMLWCGMCSKQLVTCALLLGFAYAEFVFDFNPVVFMCFSASFSTWFLSLCTKDDRFLTASLFFYSAADYCANSEFQNASLPGMLWYANHITAVYVLV